MSGYTQLPVPDMDQWNADQVLAVYDLCQVISATLMHRYEDQLVEKMMECDERHCVVDHLVEHDLSLPLRGVD